VAQIELWRSAIPEIEVDAIVNAQNVQSGGS
jgi:O-acetyl-ADP-ribose deacetylase (regulator of RNase III)